MSSQHIEGALTLVTVQFDPFITREQRAGAEAEAQAYYAANYPHVNYRGFVGSESEISIYTRD